MALAHGQSLHWARQVVLAAAYLVRYNHKCHSPLILYTPMIGTGEQIIRTALARDLCERANPNHCEDTVGGMERSFERFSGMHVRHYRPFADNTTESCEAREEKGSAGAIVVINEPEDHSTSRCMSPSDTEI